MPRVPGRALFADAAAAAYAIPAFNVSNLETSQGVLAAAEAAAAPVVLQLSPGAIAYAGYRALTRLVFELAGDASVPVTVHLDHCRDPEVVARAIDDGFGSVMFDGSTLPFEDNVATTRRLVERARGADAGIAVEAELGIIGGIEDTDPAVAWASRTTPGEAAAFVERTDIDLLAPNLGNLHRMPDDSTTLDLEHIRAIRAAAGRPLALHGGSGIDQGQLAAAIAAGVAKVNISSRVTRALARGIRETWAERPDELDLRRFLGAGRTSVQDVAAGYLAITGAAGRAADRVPDRGGTPVGTGTAWSSHIEEPE